MPTNDDRAAWAYDGIAAFAKRTGQDNSGDLKHDLPSVIGDFLADLMHLCDRDGINFDECLANGRGHYEHELAFPDE